MLSDFYGKQYAWTKYSRFCSDGVVMQCYHSIWFHKLNRIGLNQALIDSSEEYTSYFLSVLGRICIKLAFLNWKAEWKKHMDKCIFFSKTFAETELVWLSRHNCFSLILCANASMRYIRKWVTWIGKCIFVFSSQKLLFVMKLYIYINYIVMKHHVI